MNANGTGQTNLTNNSARDFPGAFSPDGTRILFSSDRAGTDDVWSMKADGSDPKNVREKAGSSEDDPMFSPDGTHIVFRSSEGSTTTNIWAMNANGTGAVNLTKNNSPIENELPAYSPDGKRIAYDSYNGSTKVGDIVVANADGSHPVNLTSTLSGDAFAPTWAPGQPPVKPTPLSRACDPSLPAPPGYKLIVGNNGSNRLKGTSGKDVIRGLGGRDTLIGRGGDDILCGGKGNDVLRGGNGNDRLIGDKGNDRLVGGKGRDSLDGGRGNDVLLGGPGKDHLDGGRGNDAESQG
jgi:Ca2+-binding RTX toxin-like protein